MTEFFKFHGTGNDFILLDGRKIPAIPSKETIAQLCHRRFGIGADGLIILSPEDGFDFRMIYFNADGSPAGMCGNGARCAVACASMIGFSGNDAVFIAGDGPHTGKLKKDSESEWIVEVSMRDVIIPSLVGKQTVIDTGTPHFVNIVPDVSEIDTFAEGRNIRYSATYAEEGINVDWLSIEDNRLRVRTYERGVENETLSCGTGVTACAMVASLATGRTFREIETPGGRLNVSFRKDSDRFLDVRLKGPVKLVFKGEVDFQSK
ncbi:MAG: diaminopimelate epimerase [Bacteroidota bacterium]